MPALDTSSSRAIRKGMRSKPSSTESIRLGGHHHHLVRKWHHELHHTRDGVLGRSIGVKKAIMTTVQAYHASQAIVDTAHTAREGGEPPAPTSYLHPPCARPQPRGDCQTIAGRSRRRRPRSVPVGSMPISFLSCARTTTSTEVNRMFVEGSRELSAIAGIVGVTTDPSSRPTSSRSRASIVDVSA